MGFPGAIGLGLGPMPTPGMSAAPLSGQSNMAASGLGLGGGLQQGDPGMGSWLLSRPLMPRAGEASGKGTAPVPEGAGGAPAASNNGAGASDLSHMHHDGFSLLPSSLLGTFPATSKGNESGEGSSAPPTSLTIGQNGNGQIW
ncbi:unnamed protein product [Pedinophyceae sp. YPF-701]|nr:unnamed protein product [Pedinophyceae sp. YPF-701]